MAHRARVSVELDDGTLARVFWLERENGKDISRELNLKEDIILSNQGELEEGTAVEPTLSSLVIKHGLESELEPAAKRMKSCIVWAILAEKTGGINIIGHDQGIGIKVPV